MNTPLLRWNDESTKPNRLENIQNAHRPPHPKLAHTKLPIAAPTAMPHIAPVISNPLSLLRALGSTVLTIYWWDTKAAITPKSNVIAPIARVINELGKSHIYINEIATKTHPNRMISNGPFLSANRGMCESTIFKKIWLSSRRR